MYVALHEVTWLYGVHITRGQNSSTEFYLAPAMSALQGQHFNGYLKMRYKKLVTPTDTQYASAASLLKSRDCDNSTI